jgi:hypothetical protein
VSRSIPLQAERRGRNLESPPWCYLLWGVPAVLIFGGEAAYQSSVLSVTVAGFIWSLSVAWIGVGCFMNGRSCGRVHCRIDGIAMPLLAIIGLLITLSLIPLSWSVFWIAFWIILIASFVPEFLWKRYS